MIRHLIRALIVAIALILPPNAFAQSSIPFKYVSTASTNSTLVDGSGQNTLIWLIVNSDFVGIDYLKFYNKKTAPLCGTDTPVMTIQLQANGSSVGLTALYFGNIRFPLGLGFCLTGGIADSDTTNSDAGVVINVGYSYR